MLKNEDVVSLFNKLILKHSGNYSKIKFHSGEIINFINSSQNEDGSIEQQLMMITDGRICNQNMIKQIAIKAGYDVDENHVIYVNNKRYH